MFSKDLSIFFISIVRQSNFENALATNCVTLNNLKFVTAALVLKSLPTPGLGEVLHFLGGYFWLFFFLFYLILNFFFRYKLPMMLQAIGMELLQRKTSDAMKCLWRYQEMWHLHQAKAH